MNKLRFPLLAAFTALLAACVDGPPPGGVATLDGVYVGEITRSSGSPISCPTAFKLRIQVTRGEMRGEVLDIEQPDAVVDRILAYIEADGRVITSFRGGSQTFGVRGRFGASTFSALADGRTCGMSAFARKQS